MSFGIKLRHIRDHRDLGQQELGEALGYTGKVASTVISQIETQGKKPRDREVYFKLSKVLNCSVQMLKDTRSTHMPTAIFPLLWISLTTGMSIDKDQYGQFILRFDNKNKNEGGSITKEIYNQLNDWYEMSQKEKAGAISEDALIDWMLKYPYSSETHYKEFFEKTGEPTNYMEATTYFDNAILDPGIHWTDAEIEDMSIRYKLMDAED